MKKVILTGGTGFLGHWLLKELSKNKVEVYVIIKKNSKRKNRVLDYPNVKPIEVDMENILDIVDYVESADTFYHLAWKGERNNFSEQLKNIEWSINSMIAAKMIGVKHFIGIGSQAEYGIVNSVISEETPTKPNTAYGSCKLSCYNILESLARYIKMDFTWARIFSVYGEGDNPNTLISYLIDCFNSNKTPKLSSGNQFWDFIYGEDTAKALYLLGKNNVMGLYNIAYGESKTIKEFVIQVRDIMAPELDVEFNSEDIRNIELRANIDKIKSVIDWEPRINFKHGIKNIKNFRYK